ncbi:S8 family serine peptidase [Deinococcus sp.]|uniref:S8 family serine peptidase n=1 Tax=Deinococcus sp. TaxID=47478 RepID=UPI00391AA633
MTLLISCGAPPTPITPTTTPPPAPAAPVTDQVTNRQVEFGYTTEQRITQPFTGNWKVVTVPPWLQVSKNSATTLDLTLRAHRRAVEAHTLTEPVVRGDIVVSWTSKDGVRSGSTTWPVTMTMYEVNGQLAPPATNGRDTATNRWTNSSTPELSNEYIVTYRSSQARDQFARSLRHSADPSDAWSETSAQIELLGPRRALLRTTQAGTLQGLRAHPDVLSVQPNAFMSALETHTPVEPDDQYYPNQWAPRLLGYPAVWRDMTTTPYQRDVVIAVLDTGVRYDHPDLRGALIDAAGGALDLVPRERSDDENGVDSDPTDPDYFGRTGGSHGTHVTGIIAARWGTFSPPCTTCSASGVAGAVYTAPVRVLPIRVIDATGTTTVATTLNGVRYAAGLPVEIEGHTFVNPTPAQVINLSLGGSMSAAAAAPLCEAITEVKRKGVLVFAAAGNTGTPTVHYPAACEDAVAVAAVTLSPSGAPQHAAYSSTFPQVRLSAPGGAGSAAQWNGSTLNGTPFPDDVISTSWDYARDQPNYAGASGTSQATPQVSALAALMLSKGVTRSADDTLARLEATATDVGRVGRDELFGVGMINPAAALGAPAVTHRFGFHVYADDGQTYTVRQRGLSFGAFLPEGNYTLRYGHDSNGNAVYGERGEEIATRSFSLGINQSVVQLGKLICLPAAHQCQ